MWYARARAIRAEFESNRHVTDREEQNRLLTHGEKLLAEWKYPEPIVNIHAPGGTSFQRNPPLPPKKFISDFGREGYEDHHQH